MEFASSGGRCCGRGLRSLAAPVARLMKEMDLQGVRRGRKAKTTLADQAAARPQDRVRRQFQAPAPDRLWVSDFTYVPTWRGFVYVAFVIGAYARRIVVGPIRFRQRRKRMRTRDGGSAARPTSALCLRLWRRPCISAGLARGAA